MNHLVKLDLLVPQSDLVVFDFQDDGNGHANNNSNGSSGFNTADLFNLESSLSSSNASNLLSLLSSNDMKPGSNSIASNLINAFMSQQTSPVLNNNSSQSYDRTLSLNDTIALALNSKDSSFNVLPFVSELKDSQIVNNIKSDFVASGLLNSSMLSSYAQSLSPSISSPSGTVSGKSDNGQSSQQSQGMSRSASARASKAAREKRKQMLNDLIDENKKLLQEREQFLQKIDDLQTKIQEIREAEGDVDVFMENELLKSQLQEHKFFVSSLMKMASGVPTKQADRCRLYRQGADYGVTSFLSILDRSTKQILSGVDSPWKFAPIEFTQGIGLSDGLCCRYQFVDDANVPDRKRLVLRFDHIRKDCKAADVADIYWSVWTNISLLKQVMAKDEIDILLHETLTSNEAETTSTSSSTSSPLSSISSELNKMTNTVEEALATTYMREKPTLSQVPKDWVFVSTKRKQTLSKKIFQVPLQDNAPSASNEDTLGEAGKNEQGQLKKKNQKSNSLRTESKNATSAAGLESNKQRIASERVQCNIVTKCTTRHHEAFSDDSQNVKRNYITAMYLESCAMTDLEDGCHCCAVISVPANLQIGDLAFSDVIKENGNLSEVFISTTNTAANSTAPSASKRVPPS